MATNVEIADGSFITAGSIGPAAAGNITIQADTISLTGGPPDEGLFTNISTFGTGSVEGGTISLSGRASSGHNLSISDEGQILTSSISGRGGDINIEMDSVNVSGGASLVGRLPILPLPETSSSLQKSPFLLRDCLLEGQVQSPASVVNLQPTSQSRRGNSSSAREPA